MQLEDAQNKRLSLGHRFSRLARNATASIRAFPNFIIIGAQRSGTSSLFSYLIQHPQIVGSVTKEVHYFDKHFEKGPDWYRSNFPLQLINEHALIGEATPSYLYYPEVPQRISNLLPEVKLIAILRNPTERAISQYFYTVKNGGEDLPLMDALLAEESRIELEEAGQGIAKNSKKAPSQIHSYKQRGHYFQQLDRYWAHFPRNRVLIVESLALFRQPEETLREVFDFLGTDPDFKPPDLAPRNSNPIRQEVPEAVYRYLDAYFAPHNERLYAALQRDLGWGP